MLGRSTYGLLCGILCDFGRYVEDVAKSYAVLGFDCRTHQLASNSINSVTHRHIFIAHLQCRFPVRNATVFSISFEFVRHNPCRSTYTSLQLHISYITNLSLPLPFRSQRPPWQSSSIGYCIAWPSRADNYLVLFLRQAYVVGSD